MQLSAVRFSTIVITLTTQSTRCGSRTRRVSVRSTVLLAIWVYVALGCTCTVKNIELSLGRHELVSHALSVSADVLLCRLCCSWVASGRWPDNCPATEAGLQAMLPVCQRLDCYRTPLTAQPSTLGRPGKHRPPTLRANATG